MMMSSHYGFTEGATVLKLSLPLSWITLKWEHYKHLLETII